MVSRIIIVGALIAAMFLWLGPFSVPNWAVIVGSSLSSSSL
jgi:hypothetical protein